MEVRVSGRLDNPDDIVTLDKLQYYDNYAARLISDMEGAKHRLELYRQEIAARYALLSSTPYSMAVELVRHVRYDNKVYYTLSIYRDYIDPVNERVPDSAQRFEGRERYKAIAAYQDYVKSHPGISCKLDIAKSI